jgi:Ser/Thr protein kinase RdoA (MazF antagonist)
MADQSGVWGKETQHFHLLGPDEVMVAAETWGARLSGRVQALNSLENRVYDVELASAQDFGEGFAKQNLILKFYRPGRWSREQILEEHSFLEELHEFEVPVVAPINFKGSTLHLHEGTNLFYALFPKVQGRLKDEFNKQETEQVGRLIGRIHNIGSMKSFKHRLTLNPENFIQYGREEIAKIRPVDFQSFDYYLKLLDQIEQILRPVFSQQVNQRLHGDFHRGNIVWTSTAGPMAVDFDDCLSGPIEQDLWLLFPGIDEDSQKDKDTFLMAYREMTRNASVNPRLTEALRTMRMIHFNTWIAKRWDDHSFQRVFPQFNTSNYWDQQLMDMRIQIGLIQDQLGM